MDLPLHTPVLVTLLATLVATVTDIWRFKVYNVLTFPLLAMGLLYHAAVSGGAGLGSSLLGAIVVGGLLAIPYAAGGMGAGDVKLMAGIGAWLGWPAGLLVLAASCIAAGCFALLVAGWYGTLAETLHQFQCLFCRLTVGSGTPAAATELATLASRRDRRRIVPFGAMAAAGLVAVIAVGKLAA
jgi:prepilin peptidase CpaA